VLTASSTGTRTTLDGVIACKDNDELGIFYPGSYVTGFDQGKMPVVMTASYINDNKGQDGSKENLKYFDYSYGKGKVTVNGASASGSVDMKKLYSVLELNFTAGGVKLTNIKKLVLSNVLTEAVYNIQSNQLESLETGKIEVNSPVALEKVYVAILPQNHFSPTFEVYTTDNKAYRFAVSTPNFNLVAAKVYPFTVQVKEFTPNPPYIEIGGVKWGKYNLQYTPGKKTDGWEDGYHLAANPWDYFYTTSSPAVLDVTPVYDADNASRLGDQQMWDHFRWGDISKAHNYAYKNKNHYYNKTTQIKEFITSNKEYGDLPYYASKKKWRLPTWDDYKNLMKNSTEYVGYYSVGTTTKIYGVLFVPDGKAHGSIVGKNGNILMQSNVTGTISNDDLREFTAAEINKGVFFPATGTYNAYSDGNPTLEEKGKQGLYWTADYHDADRGVSFTFYETSSGFNVATVGNANANPKPHKHDMYSIRPIYIGQ